jgi:hypothetical protein
MRLKLAAKRGPRQDAPEAVERILKSEWKFDVLQAPSLSCFIIQHSRVEMLYGPLAFPSLRR